MRSIILIGILMVPLGCTPPVTESAPQAKTPPTVLTPLPTEVVLTPIKVQAFEEEIKTKYRGQVVAADVWFLGCAPCKKKMPDVVALAKEYAPQGAIIMTVDQMPEDLEQKADVVQFLESVDATIPNYIFDDTEDAIYIWKERAGFRPTPAMVFYDKKGELVKSLIAPTKAEVAAELDRLLAQ